MTGRATEEPATVTGYDDESATVPGAGPDLPPTTIQRYRIEKLLGAGGMGVVYAAYDPELERRVALKVLPDPASGRESRQRLLREARAMARLTHPNVVTVYEAGSAPDGRDYVAMELVEGVSLAEWLRQNKPRPRAIVAAFVAAGRGLAAAHASGIVHRDFKPRNVLCRRDGRIHVTDFGLAVSVSHDDEAEASRNTPSKLAGLTETGAVLGTPAYMSPEQWDGEPAGPAADQFAFCVALWEALAGERPYRGRRAELRSAIEQGPAALDASKIPRGLRATLRRGLEEDPDRRWPSMDALLAQIARWQRGPVLPLALGAVGLAALGVTVGVFAMGGKTAPPCAYDASLLAGRWDDTKRATLRTAIADPKRQAKVDAVIAALDQRGKDIADGLRDTCRAQEAEEVSEAEARMTGSCLARRAFELGSVVSQHAAAKSPVINVAASVQALANPRDCGVVVAPPIGVPERTMALYDRFAGLVSIPHPTGGSAEAAAASDVAAGEALEHDAIAANELELAARAAFAIGLFEQRRSGADAADAAMQRAHRVAVDVRNANIGARALVERSHIAGRLRGDMRAAYSLAELAVDLANKPTTMPRTRATAYEALGRAQRDRGELTAAAANLRKALDAVPHDALTEPYTELDIRFALITTLAGIDDQRKEAVALARATVDLVRGAFGEHHGEYAVAINMLAVAVGAESGPAAALPYSRQALAVQIEVDGPETVRTTWQRLDLARALVDADEPAEAKPLIAIVMKRVEHDASLRGNKPSVLETAGRVAFETGDFDEGVRLLDEAVEAQIELAGANTTLTEEARAQAIGAQLELGHAEDAARRIATLERSYRTHTDDSAEAITRLDGLKADVARLRGQHAQAVGLARAALTAAEQHHAAARVRAQLSYRLAVCLADARRYPDALAMVEQARRLGAESSASLREDALVNAVAADVEAGLGHRTVAVTLAEHARPVLARFPGEIQANKRLKALLARRGSKP